MVIPLWVKAARIGIAGSAAVCVAITAPFAASFFSSYGSDNGEIAPQWLAATDWPTPFSGSTPEDAYAAHGVAWSAALIILALLLAALVRKMSPGGRWTHAAWWTTTSGFAGVALGGLGEYALADGSAGANMGYGVELFGFAVLLLSIVVHAVSWWRDFNLSGRAASSLALLGFGGVFAGTAAFAHIPSGVALFLIIAVTVAVLRGHPHGTTPLHRTP